LAIENANDTIASEASDFTQRDLMTSLCLLVGLWQVKVKISDTVFRTIFQTLFSMLGFGKLSWILSDVLVSGYTTGAAVHVLGSQVCQLDLSPSYHYL